MVSEYRLLRRSIRHGQDDGMDCFYIDESGYTGLTC